MKLALKLSAAIFVIGFSCGAEAVERSQKFGDIEVTQTSDPVCVGLRISYRGKQTHQERLQAYVNLNGASGIFEMERAEESQSLTLSSCPGHPVEMRKVFYFASQNGKPTPWFLELAFLDEKGDGRDDGHHDNFSFYFP